MTKPQPHQQFQVNLGRHRITYTPPRFAEEAKVATGEQEPGFFQVSIDQGGFKICTRHDSFQLARSYAEWLLYGRNITAVIEPLDGALWR